MKIFARVSWSWSKIAVGHPVDGLDVGVIVAHRSSLDASRAVREDRTKRGVPSASGEPTNLVDDRDSVVLPMTRRRDSVLLPMRRIPAASYRRDETTNKEDPT